MSSCDLVKRRAAAQAHIHTPYPHPAAWVAPNAAVICYNHSKHYVLIPDFFLTLKKTNHYNK